MNNGVREIKVIQPTMGLNEVKKIRMAAYCRVSSDSDDQLNSFMAQMRYYSDYIRSHDAMTRTRELREPASISVMSSREC